MAEAIARERETTGRVYLDLTEGAVIKVQIQFCLPILLANLLQTAYNFVDMAIVGRFLDVNALSAVSITGDIVLLINLICNGLCSGAQILVSQYTGAKDDRSVKRCFGTLLSTFVLLSFALTALMILFGRPLLRFMNTAEECWAEAVVYSITCYTGIFAIFGYGILGALLRGMGDSRHPLLFVGVSSVLNLLLDLAFIVWFRWGVFGAAFATVLSQTVSFFWALSYLYRNRERFGLRFDREAFRPGGDILRPFFKIAIPIFLQNALMQGVTIYINSFIYAYGVTASAINGVGNRLTSILIIITNSLNRSGSSMVGQNIAAGKLERVKKVFWFNLLAGSAFAVLFSGVSILFREQVFGIFTTNADALALSALYLPALIIRYLSFATRSPSLSLINGIGMPKLNLLIAFLDTFVFRAGVSLLLGLALGMGLQGFWFGTAVGGFTPFIVALPYYLSGKWKTVRLVSRKPA